MSYLKDLDLKCEYRPGCKRRAKKTLYNNRNAPMGNYCAVHARWKLKYRLALERPCENNQAEHANGRKITGAQDVADAEKAGWFSSRG
jgi:hypothetical protein